jgi:hypothetical protein
MFFTVWLMLRGEQAGQSVSSEPRIDSDVAGGRREARTTQRRG